MCRFRKLIEREFRGAHVITQAFLLETFESLVLSSGHARPSSGQFIGKDGVLFALLYAAIFPFIGQFLSGTDGLKLLIDPFTGIAFALIGGDKPICNQFRIKRFLDPFPPNLGQP